jgi:hypothetical protein
MLAAFLHVSWLPYGIAACEMPVVDYNDATPLNLRRNESVKCLVYVGCSGCPLRSAGVLELSCG